MRMSSEKANCPACKARIPLWVVIRALTLNRVRCTQCRSRLKVSGSHWPLNLLGVLLGGGVVAPCALGIFLLCSDALGEFAAGLLAFAAFTALVVLVDTPVSMYVSKRRGFELPEKKGAPKPWVSHSN